LIAAIGCACTSNTSWAQEEHELAKQLANPIASLISVPFQNNWDTHIGPARDGDRYYVNFQPVIPVSLDKDWNLISRTIVPLISQRNVLPGSGTQTGVGDITQSFFFSPKAPGPGGIIWGVGPALFIPGDGDPLLSSQKWGAGPTGVALIQNGGWTLGVLANQNWSYAGDSNRPDVNQTFVQPFVSYTTKDAWTFTVDTESTFDWVNHQWSVPINFEIAKPRQIWHSARPIPSGPPLLGRQPRHGGARPGRTVQCHLPVPHWEVKLITTEDCDNRAPQWRTLMGRYQYICAALAVVT
jgi:hypothetical protein